MIDFNSTTTPTNITVIIPDPNTTTTIDVAVLIAKPAENMSDPVFEQVSSV